MTIINTHTITVQCDRCGYVTYAETERELTGAGWADLGWSMTGHPENGKHLCPDCATVMRTFMRGGGRFPDGAQ